MADTTALESPRPSQRKLTARQNQPSAEKPSITYTSNENTAATEIYDPMWLEKYGMTPLQMAEDPDQDGLTNREEMMAGSDPLGWVVASRASIQAAAPAVSGGKITHNAGDLYQKMLTKGKEALHPSRERAAALRLKAEKMESPPVRHPALEAPWF